MVILRCLSGAPAIWAIDHVANLHAAYVEADYRTRRLINQAMFERFTISDDGEIVGELHAPFRLLLQATGTADEDGAVRSGSKDKPRASRKARGLSKHDLVEENGARLNRDRLANAYLLARSLAARPEPQPQSQSQIRRRAGAVQEAVIQVLTNGREATPGPRDPLSSAEALRNASFLEHRQGLLTQERTSGWQPDRTGRLRPVQQASVSRHP